MPVTIICQHCGELFEVKPSRATTTKYCSNACKGLARRGKETSEYVDAICQSCGAAIHIRKCQWDKGQGRFCSTKCQHESAKRQVELVCAHCGKCFNIPASMTKEHKGYTRKYCSDACKYDSIRETDRAEYIDTNCLTCGRPLHVLKSRWDDDRGRYCSQGCMIKQRPTKPNGKVLTNCEYCGKEFVAYKCWLKKGGGKFCSKACAYKGRERHEFRDTVPTSIEQALIDELNRRQIEYTPQYHIGWYILDFAFPDAYLDVEADGEYWHSGERMAEHDRRRDAFLKRRGWTVLRFTEAAINDSPQECVNEIERVLKRLNDQRHNP